METTGDRRSAQTPPPSTQTCPENIAGRLWAPTRRGKKEMVEEWENYRDVKQGPKSFVHFMADCYHFPTENTCEALSGPYVCGPFFCSESEGKDGTGPAVALVMNAPGPVGNVGSQSPPPPAGGASPALPTLPSLKSLKRHHDLSSAGR